MPAPLEGFVDLPIDVLVGLVLRFLRVWVSRKMECAPESLLASGTRVVRYVKGVLKMTAHQSGLCLLDHGHPLEQL